MANPTFMIHYSFNGEDWVRVSTSAQICIPETRREITWVSYDECFGEYTVTPERSDSPEQPGYVPSWAEPLE